MQFQSAIDLNVRCGSLPLKMCVCVCCYREREKLKVRQCDRNVNLLKPFCVCRTVNLHYNLIERFLLSSKVPEH